MKNMNVKTCLECWDKRPRKEWQDNGGLDVGEPCKLASSCGSFVCS